jgi:hypothetical protein
VSEYDSRFVGSDPPQDDLLALPPVKRARAKGRTFVPSRFARPLPSRAHGCPSVSPAPPKCSVEQTERVER